MNIDEFDWRIGPLERVVVAIDEGLAAIGAQIGDPEWYDGLHACEDAEPLLGLGFVAFRTYALGTVGDLIRIRASRGKLKITKEGFKHDCYSCDPIAVKQGVTRIQLMSAIANFSSIMTSGQRGLRAKAIRDLKMHRYWHVLTSRKRQSFLASKLRICCAAQVGR